ncbi:hypothetical protein [Blastococcus brunescens]|uniref:Uncharacterized protein n=1 Tax=Blastococcus brunescens TaxID=1564165 RepID=A0ABZ1AW59_9ACTN|nr:hypothetical protein [Blastococcus sp. BMG 8361]WRL62797.1 hypothetical protein U6N30_23320 [Blastococcus sp. BMG 8361]
MSSSDTTRGSRPAEAAIAVAAGTCASPTSKRNEPPGTSQSPAPAATRRATSSPSSPPSSAARGS